MHMFYLYPIFRNKNEGWNFGRDLKVNPKANSIGMKWKQQPDWSRILRSKYETSYIQLDFA